MRNKLIIFTGSIYLFLAVLNFGSITSAQSTESNCDLSEVASAVTKLPSSDYEVYAQLGSSSTSDNAVVSVRELSDEDAECVVVGSTTLNSEKFTKIGDVSVTDSDAVEVFLSSAKTTSSQMAGGPRVVFVPRGQSICDFALGCNVSYAGSSFSLSPKKVSLNSDALQVGLLEDFKDKKIVKVVYAVDQKPVYEKPTVEKFNERYVSTGTHTISRRVIFESGISLTESKTIKRGSVANAGYIFQSVISGQSKIITVVLSAVILFMLWLGIMAIVKRRHRKRLWQQAHGTESGALEYDPLKVGAQANFQLETNWELIVKYRRWLYGVVALVSVMLLSSSYIIGFFNVDGVSMYPTLQDGSVHPLVKVERTVSRLNGSQYIPKRGEIVVVHKGENNLFVTDVEAELKSFVVKRVVALPGERVTIKDGVIKVFNKDRPRGFVPDDQFKWVKDLTGSEDFVIDLTLKESEIFVVGDNRDESIDSRFYGPIDTSEVQGRVII